MTKPPITAHKCGKRDAHSSSGSCGFSLVELAAGLAVAAVVLMAVVSVFTTLSRSYTTQNVTASVQQVARVGLEYMAQNIRMAGLNPQKRADFDILSATATSIDFKLDVNLNGQLDPKERIAYIYDGADKEVTRAVDDGTAFKFIANVTGFNFTYFDQIGNDLGPAPDPAAIRSVEILLTITAPAGRDKTASIDRTYSTHVICRNLGL